jgi:hypothetical protein
LTEVETKQIPTTEAAVVVPVPPGAVRFLTIFPVTVALEVDMKIPATCVPDVAAAAVLCNELDMVPPIILLDSVVATVDEVFNLRPYTLAAPVLVFETVIPPILLLFAVQASTLKLKIPITSEAEVDPEA